MTGLEIPAILLGKWLVGKAVIWGGGHLLAGASSATLTHASMHAATNIIAAGAGAGSIAGAGAAVYAGADSYMKFAKEVEKRKGKNAAIASMKAGALAEPLGPLRNILTAQVFVTLEELYKSLEILDTGGEKKTELDEIEICKEEGCECLDYIGDEEDSVICRACGHNYSIHDSVGEDETRPDIALLLLAHWAKDTYAELGRQKEDFAQKTDIEADVMPCTKCGCTDYRRRENAASCHCGHNAAGHTQDDPPPEKLKEFLVEILAESLYKKLGHCDKNNRSKTSLYQIDPCFKSGCWDFNYSWSIPFTDEDMCKCGSRWSTHRRYEA